jgi:hypothetical protein
VLTDYVSLSLAGKIAAEDAFDEIRNSIANSNMVFVTGGQLLDFHLH